MCAGCALAVSCRRSHAICWPRLPYAWLPNRALLFLRYSPMQPGFADVPQLKPRVRNPLAHALHKAVGATLVSIVWQSSQSSLRVMGCVSEECPRALRGFPPTTSPRSTPFHLFILYVALLDFGHCGTCCCTAAGPGRYSQRPGQRSTASGPVGFSHPHRLRFTLGIVPSRR